MVVDFNKQGGLVPVVIQDIETYKVLMLGFMNEEALEKTTNEKIVTFFSRSKNRLWTKGETSGNFLYVKEILTDCDNDTILIKVKPNGEVCHTGADTCFNEKNVGKALFLNYLQNDVIRERKENPKEESYTSNLFKKGVNKIAQKVGEEAVELVIEAKDNDDDLFKNEAADLVYHFLILLEEKNINLDDVIDILKQRHK